MVQVGFYLLSIPLVGFWLATLVCNYALVFWCMYLLFAGLDYLYSPHHIVEHEWVFHYSILHRFTKHSDY